VLDLMAETAEKTTGEQRDVDVIVIGAGPCGIYAMHRFREQGLSVLGLESTGGVGGVWRLNRYPGARVDVPSIEYCFLFSREIYSEWPWSELYASQPELEAYLNFVADKLDVKKHILFNHRVTGARWLPEQNRWWVKTDNSAQFTCRFLVTAMGNLTAPNAPDFPGLSDFKGEWVQTARWPRHEVELRGRRIGIVGTGASGLQTIPVLAGQAKRLTVFQRSPNYVVPAQNRPLDPWRIREIAERLDDYRAELLTTSAAVRFGWSQTVCRLDELAPAEREAALEAQWARGGAGLGALFAEAQLDPRVNEVISDFVRRKIRAIVNDPAVAEKLCPKDHGIGNRRLGICDGYYETYNRDNVTLVDLQEDPIERITEAGIQTRSGHHELDLIVFALGFRSFTGTLIDADIRNAAGALITEHWRPGWKTVLGFMTSGFPNLFMAGGAGGIGFSANMIPFAEQQINWIGDCIAYVDAHGHSRIEADPVAEAAWVEHVAKTASRLLLMRRNVRDRGVHVDPETGQRVCMTYLGGLPDYIERCERSAANGYEGFVLS